MLITKLLWGSTLTSLIGHGSRSPRLLPWQCWIRVEGHVQFRLPWSALTARKETLYVSLAKTLTWDVGSPFFSPSLSPFLSLSLCRPLIQPSCFCWAVISTSCLTVSAHDDMHWSAAHDRFFVWASIGSNLHSTWISCAGFSYVSFLKPMVSLNQWFLPMVFFYETIAVGHAVLLISARAAPWGFLEEFTWNMVTKTI